ncbi:MAG: all-trans-retinol 13,14-reductase [Rhodobacteraceae bacterium HLUCCA08]|nr:MAG: all-trans-retinol 13,14-reductase [Rhodobacteraceae bacterium HLUCCA08]
MSPPSRSAFDTVVIGAGLGGLSAAALLARDGLSVLVLERADHVGGAATTLARDGVAQEMSLHMTVPPGGTPDPKAAILDRLGLRDLVDFVPVPALYELRSPAVGAPFVLPAGMDPAEAALTARFPEAAGAIAGFLDELRGIQGAMALMSERHDGRWWRGHLADLPRGMWALLRDYRHSLSQVMQRHFGDNEALKLCLAANLPYYADDPDRLWWLGYGVAQGGFLAGGGAYIRGGSQRLAEALAGGIRDRGGRILCGHAATGVLTDADGAVCAVRHVRGDRGTAEVPCRSVIANAAPHALVDLLPAPAAEALSAEIADRPLSLSLFHVSYRMARSGSDLGIGQYATVLLPDWMQRLTDWRAAGAALSTHPHELMPPLITVDYGQIDAGLSAAGRPAPITVTGIDRVSNWAGLSEADRRARKAAWIAAITARLEAEWPGFAAAVQSAEMATAETMARHLGTPGGALYGFAPEPPARLMSGPPMRVRTAVPGLFLGSAFSGFGGYSGAMGGGAGAAAAVRRFLG